MMPPLATTLSRLDDPMLRHESAAFSEAMARLQFALEHRQNLVALVGPQGCGKSALLRSFRKQLAASPAIVVHVNAAGLGERDLQTALTQQLGMRRHNSWPALCERLIECGYDQTPVVVLLDNSEHMLPEAFDFLLRLWDADPHGQLHLLLVMATDELSLAQWPDAWLSRVDLRVSLEWWSPGDVAAFLRLAMAGDSRRSFDNAAIHRIWEMSGGSPRGVRRIARLSLLAAEGQERTTVDEPTVSGVSYELCRAAPDPTAEFGPAVEFLDPEFFPAE
jgi:general secretion pathway protein A